MTLRVEVSGTETITYTQAWNAENRLSVVTNTVSGAVTRFVYDGDGNRVLREQPDGSVTAYLGVVEVTLSGTERLTTSYYFAGAQRIAMREGVTLTYLHGDHLGSASLATDAGGAQVSAMRYTPFGETRYGDTPTDFRFTGQREEDFGLYDYGARFYSPGLGRFVSADVIIPDFANPQSLNRYAYVGNNPLKYTDPSGHTLRSALDLIRQYQDDIKSIAEQYELDPILLAGVVFAENRNDYNWLRGQDWSTVFTLRLFGGPEVKTSSVHW